MRRRVVVSSHVVRVFAGIFISAVLLAQTPYDTSIKPMDVAGEIGPNRGAAAVWQSLQKLGTRASLLMITAHPDDEDGAMLTYESRRRGTRVALLSLNRGEGGANLMSPDFFDALGLVRTMELIEAARRYGVELHWTPLIDYGFSKTRDEALLHWSRDRVLYDVVRVVRLTRPLIVTSVFVGGPSDGHGNHQLAGQIAAEVSELAGDPNVFPDQIKAGLRPWKPLRHFARVPFASRGAGATVEIPVGEYDPLLGISYAQLAREGLGWQKSQTGGPSVALPGPQTSYYLAPKDGTKRESFFAGIDTSLESISDAPAVRPHLSAIAQAVAEAVERFDARKPSGIAPQLARGLKAAEDAIATAQGMEDVLHELRIKRAQFHNALALSLGVSVSANVAGDGPESPMMTMFRGLPDTFRVAIPGQKFAVNVRVANGSGAPLKVARTYLEAEEGWRVEPAGDTRFTVEAPESARLTRPHFTRPGLEQPWYDISNQSIRNESLPPYPLSAWAEFEYEGARFRVGQVVQTARRVSGLGTVSEPLVVGPALSVSVQPRKGIVPNEAKSFPVTVQVRSNVKGPAQGVVRLQLPAGWKSEPASAPLQTSADGEERSFSFQVTPARIGSEKYDIGAVAEFGGKQFREGYVLAGYPGLRPYFLYRPAVHSTRGVDVSVAPGLKVAYVAGTGDQVAEAIETLGVKPTFLSGADLASGNLAQYDAIVLGVRAYAARQDVVAHNNRLLEYVNAGGTLVVQYNTPEFDHNFGPYPYVMGPNPEEVTDEHSRIEILEPSHPLLAWPNRITAADFDKWVEERGSKFLKSWDARYTPLLSTQDAGQEPQKGGLVVARHGKGTYIYNAYALYRQLPEGVAGAYRLLANLISAGKRE